LAKKPFKREVWSTRIGVILAMSGTAIGLGNLVRFPSQIAKSGAGGSFMFPYFIALILLGIPILWVEWTIGRYGGERGHGSLPMIFNKISKNPIAKYLGVFGLAIPLFIASYYTWITSWGLSFSIFSLFGTYFGEDKTQFLLSFTGGNTSYFSTILYSFIAYIFVLLALFYILSKGIRNGIEKFVNIFMPLLLLFGFILMIKVLTLGGGIIKGLAYIWEPDFSQLLNWEVWILAAGQIFFTLSIGQEISVFASYLKKDDDIALGPLTQVGINEFAEVIIGSSIAIPAIFFFTGTLSTFDTQGYNLAFTAMPMVIEQMAFGQFFGCIWFFLLFLAGFTTILASCQTFITFLQDSFGYSNKKSAIIVVLLTFVLSLPPVLWYNKGVFDDVDFWMGALFLVVISLIEVIMFGWVMGIDKAWENLNRGASIKIPPFFKYIIKYITPLMLIFLLVAWGITDAPSYILEANLFIWIERIIMMFVIILLLFLIFMASKKMR